MQRDSLRDRVSEAIVTNSEANFTILWLIGGFGTLSEDNFTNSELFVTNSADFLTSVGMPPFYLENSEVRVIVNEFCLTIAYNGSSKGWRTADCFCSFNKWFYLRTRLSPNGTTGNSLLLASLGEGIERSPQSNGNMLQRLTSFCGEYS